MYTTFGTPSSSDANTSIDCPLERNMVVNSWVLTGEPYFFTRSLHNRPYAITLSRLLRSFFGVSHRVTVESLLLPLLKIKDAFPSNPSTDNSTTLPAS